MNNDLWAIIPAHNEEERIEWVIKGVKDYCKNIIVVDDGSKDNTFNVAKKLKVIVLRHIVNLGKGAALKTGCEFAIKHNAKKFIFIDSDGQHDPEDINKFLEALKEKDIVFSYRVMKGRMPGVLRFGNWFINKTAKVLFGVKIRDTQCGYRALTVDAYQKIKWISTGYNVESEMVTNTGKKKLRYGEIPIKTVYSDRYKGTTVIDGIKIVWNMFLWRLRI